MARQSISKNLRDELVELLSDLPPQRVELVLATGKAYTEQALRLADAYDAATPAQRQALDTLAELICSRRAA